MSWERVSLRLRREKEPHEPQVGKVLVVVVVEIVVVCRDVSMV